MSAAVLRRLLRHCTLEQTSYGWQFVVVSAADDGLTINLGLTRKCGKIKNNKYGKDNKHRRRVARPLGTRGKRVPAGRTQM